MKPRLNFSDFHLSRLRQLTIGAPLDIHGIAATLLYVHPQTKRVWVLVDGKQKAVDAADVAIANGSDLGTT